ncbi:MAG: peptidylprolyl isomerase [Endomicrobiales bacterium]|nr:peptidylprolyl isomerase [Endomicrobiales bacterium]
MAIKKGDKVKIQYVGKLSNGNVFDKSQEQKPLEFTVGTGQVISGFDREIEGMNINEEKSFTIKAEDAYGNKREDLVIDFPASKFPKDFEPKVGVALKLKNQDGKVFMATIVSVTQDNLKLDLNHPLAGEDLTFDVKVQSVE